MPGRRMSFWIGEALRRARETEDPDGVLIKTIATALNMHERKLIRVEGNEGEDVQSYNDIDRVVAAYAYVLDIEDPRSFWIDALELWYRDGAMPEVSANLPGARFVRPIRDEARRQQRARAEPGKRLDAMKNRPANRTRTARARA